MRRTLLAAVLVSVSLWVNAQEEPGITVQLGHSDAITSLAFSPDGRYIVSGSTDRTLRLWEAATGKELRAFSGHSENIFSVAFLPDGRHFVSGSWDGTLKLWDAACGTAVRTMFGRSGKIHRIAVSPDGKLALSLSLEEGAVRLWNLATGKEVRGYPFEFPLYSASQTVAFSRDGKLGFLGNAYGLVLFEIASGTTVRSVGFKEPRYHPVFLPDGTGALLCEEKGDLVLWDFEAARALRTFKGQAEGASAIAVSTDGRYAFLSAYRSGSWILRLLDLHSGAEVWTTASPGIVDTLVFSPDGKTVLAGSEDRIMKLYEAASGAEITTFAGETSPVSSVALSSDGRMALTGSWDGAAHLWDLGAGKKRLTLLGHKDFLEALSFSPDNRLALARTRDGTQTLWDLGTGKEVKTFSSAIPGIFSPDGKRVLLVSGSRVVGYELSSGTLEQIVAAPPGAFAFSHDGRSLLLRESAGSGDERLALWSIPSGKRFQVSDSFGTSILSAAFSRDGAYLLAGLFDNTARLLEIASAREIRTFAYHADAVSAVAFSPDRAVVLTGSADNLLKSWDTASGKEIRSCVGHGGAVTSLACSTDGKHALSGSRDGTARLWDVTTGDWTALVASRDGSQWLIYTKDGYWDSSTRGGELVAMVRGVEAWNIDQFAPRNNRPDMVLRRTGLGDPDAIKHFFNQFRKRLKRLGLKEEDLIQELHVPVSELTAIERKGKTVELALAFSDSAYNLKSYSVFVNDVPVFGALGKPLSGTRATRRETVELTRGTNKIEVSCLNEHGAESYRALTYAPYDGTADRDLYFIGFGVSSYKDPELNLNYAHKDVLDMAALVSRMSGTYRRVHVFAFTDAKATAESIGSAKRLLDGARADDTFVLFIAGHGVHDHDEAATYYFLTYETDLNDLRHSAADFDRIEDLLQGIAPRNKLFLMDTCESGELDEDEQAGLSATAGSRGIRARALPRSADPAAAGIPARPYLLEKDRYIYNDLTRRSGAVVFSSCRGGEFSYESDEIGNGFFTSAILRTLRGTAGSGKAAFIAVDELRRQVTAAVSQMSDGLQNPTVDRDNLYQRFAFPVVP